MAVPWAVISLHAAAERHASVAVGVERHASVTFGVQKDDAPLHHLQSLGLARLFGNDRPTPSRSPTRQAELRSTRSPAPSPSLAPAPPVMVLSK
ncbi:hypothetical protein [Mycobacterium asiaticum]|uniref:hypothetical protein n=1 Tax=Mycobacterium asiaticum TaxID=1790 RepID=UPI00056B563E|nr:hypothetical protein [Mycobacterium asiaticum]ORA17007.1 hypothetical protein BST16_04855 [Mycobacterium asiaticum DSM 44297]